MAYCNNCGSEIIGNGAYCTTCGAPVAAAPAQPAYNAAEKAAADAKIEANFGKALAATICSAFPVASIVSMAEVVEKLEGTVITPELKAAIDAYYEQYGVR